MLLLLNDENVRQWLRAVAAFFYDPILYYTFVIVFVDFFFGVYRSWVTWHIASHLFDRTVDKLTKYTLTFILFHTLSLFPLPKLMLATFTLFDPVWIDDVIMFFFMSRETLSILENLLAQPRIASSWPGLHWVVVLLGRVLRLAEVRTMDKINRALRKVEEESNESDENCSQVDKGQP